MTLPVHWYPITLPRPLDAVVSSIQTYRKDIATFRWQILTVLPVMPFSLVGQLKAENVSFSSQHRILAQDPYYQWLDHTEKSMKLTSTIHEHSNLWKMQTFTCASKRGAMYPSHHKSSHLSHYGHSYIDSFIFDFLSVHTVWLDSPWTCIS